MVLCDGLDVVVLFGLNVVQFLHSTALCFQCVGPISVFSRLDSSLEFPTKTWCNSKSGSPWQVDSRPVDFRRLGPHLLIFQSAVSFDAFLYHMSHVLVAGRRAVLSPISIVGLHNNRSKCIHFDTQAFSSYCSDVLKHLVIHT